MIALLTELIMLQMFEEHFTVNEESKSGMKVVEGRRKDVKIAFSNF